MTSDEKKKIVASLQQIVGVENIYTKPEEAKPFLQEKRRLFEGQCLCVTQPQTSEQIAAILRFAREKKLAIVPQGGNTGLVGGQIPRQPQDIVLSLAKMNAISQFDPLANTLVVESGVTLAALHDFLKETDLFFPLALPSQEKSQIGGVIATNAGGTAVVRYGMMRKLVLGLEVILAHGEILDMNQGLEKNNSGYDLKQLFIGSEGTLGIITKATLKLFHRPKAYVTVLFPFQTIRQALDLFQSMQAWFCDAVTGFEIMCPNTLALIQKALATLMPLPALDETTWLGLVDIPTSAAWQAEKALEKIFSSHHVASYSLTCDEFIRRDVWNIRHSLHEKQKEAGVSIKHDIGLPLSRIESFIKRAKCAILSQFKDVRLMIFGHLGDGNLHFNVMEPKNFQGQFSAYWEPISTLVHTCVLEMGGTISAEHGIGQLKMKDMTLMYSPQVLAAMAAVKKCLDPLCILNPNKVIYKEEI